MEYVYAGLDKVGDAVKMAEDFLADEASHDKLNRVKQWAELVLSQSKKELNTPARIFLGCPYRKEFLGVFEQFSIPVTRGKIASDECLDFVWRINSMLDSTSE